MVEVNEHVDRGLSMGCHQGLISKGRGESSTRSENMHQKVTIVQLVMKASMLVYSPVLTHYVCLHINNIHVRFGSHTLKRIWDIGAAQSLYHWCPLPKIFVQS